MFRTHFLLLCFLAVAPIALVAQETGSLHVIVTDPSGAAVPGAQVVIQDEQHNEQRVDRNDGDYSDHVAQKLAPGVYRLEVASPGFDSYVIEKLLIHFRENQTLRVT